MREVGKRAGQAAVGKKKVSVDEREAQGTAVC